MGADYIEAINEFYRVYRPLKEKYKWKMHMHSDISGETLIEIRERGETVCTVKEKGMEKCYRAATQDILHIKRKRGIK